MNNLKRDPLSPAHDPAGAKVKLIKEVCMEKGLILEDTQTQIDELEDELILYKAALIKAVALPKGQLPSEDGRYFSCIINGNIVVRREHGI